MKRFSWHWLTRWFQRSAAPHAGDHAGHAHVSPTMDGEMLDCESVMRQLWDYLDGELTPRRMEQVRNHIEMCKRCYPQYEFEHAFLEAVAARRRTHSDPERLQRKLAAALRDSGLTPD